MSAASCSSSSSWKNQEFEKLDSDFYSTIPLSYFPNKNKNIIFSRKYDGSRNVISASEFVNWCKIDKPRLHDSLKRWDQLYLYYEAEICDRRRKSYFDYYNKDISDSSSMELCLAERYTACVNFRSNSDTLVRHVCDMLPIVIGSNLDRKIRKNFWSNKDNLFFEDIKKIGLLIQNKNLYHFTVTMATNPKVAHIYRKSNKLNNIDSRVYYYDNNFRGNMFRFKQSVIFLNCSKCLKRLNENSGKRKMKKNDQDVSSLVEPTSECNSPTCIICEEIVLRNCFKQDYLLLRKFCTLEDNSDDSHSHDTIMKLIKQFVQQYDKTQIIIKRIRNSIYKNVSDMLKSLGTCEEFFSTFINSQCGSVFTSLENDLRTFITNFYVLDGIDLSYSIPKIHIKLVKETISKKLLLCECNSEKLQKSFHNCYEGKECVIFIDNINEFKKISNSCFNVSSDSDFATEENNDTYYRTQLYVLYLYMRQVMSKNEDIDQLSNKCVFDGPYLYNKLMYQMQEFLVKRISYQKLDILMIDAFISRYRRLAHTGNLYMLISSKTNIRIELSNDMKRSLKLGVKLEKMQQTGYLSNSIGNLERNSSTEIFQNVALLSNNALPTLLTANRFFTKSVNSENFSLSPTNDNDLFKTFPSSSSFSIDNEANEKCDFIIRANSKLNFKNFCTEYIPEENKIMLSSCSKGDINVKQLIAYNSQNLLLNIAAAHFTDTEFILETVKRPNVTNQHNSIKCSLMPRGSARFLSYYNIGNLSSAGRNLNICARNTITFFRNYDNIYKEFEIWFKRVYTDIIKFFPLSSHSSRSEIFSCVAHDRINCFTCFQFVVINEIPCVSFKIDKFYEKIIFFTVKYFWPAAQFYRKSPEIINITLISGIIMIPMVLVMGTTPTIDGTSIAPLLDDSWVFCEHCNLYFPHYTNDRASNIAIIPKNLRNIFSIIISNLSLIDYNLDGGIISCSKHLWFSSNDLEYYERNINFAPLNDPFVYEVACHGLFLNLKFFHSTEISKLMVSINASKRRLRTLECSGGIFESLVDQNSRMSISSWSSSKEKNNILVNFIPYENEPLNEIVELPENNLFRCCFMFGDWKGRNCEDAYVFDVNSRPLLNNVIQLKLNFCRIDKLPINGQSLRINFMPSVTTYNNGSIFFLATLISNYKLSFGSTFVHVKTIQINEYTWIYKFYYVNNASYLRQDQPIFCEEPDDVNTLINSTSGDDIKFNDEKDPCSVVNFGKIVNEGEIFEYRNKNRIVNLCGYIFNETKTTKNGNIKINCQITNKQLRFLIELKKIKTIQKWQNNCGNKGVSNYVDLSDLYTGRGGRVHVIVSAYSMIGRELIAQLLEQFSCAGSLCNYKKSLIPVYSKKLKRQIGYCGYGDFFFSCDSPHESIIVSSPNFGNNATRMCNMTYYAAIGNNLSTWIGNRSANHVNYKNNPISGMPLNVNLCLSVYHYYNRQLYSKNHLIRELRKKLCDSDELHKHRIESSLPTSIKFDYDFDT